MREYHITSKEDKVDAINVDRNLNEALEEIIGLNGHKEIGDTDWNITENGILIVEDGIIITA